MRQPVWATAEAAGGKCERRLRACFRGWASALLGGGGRIALGEARLPVVGPTHKPGRYAGHERSTRTHRQGRQRSPLCLGTLPLFRGDHCGGAGCTE